MLVMYLALEGNNNYQFKYMHKKLTTWADPIREGDVQQNEVWKSLNSTITQTIKYPLPSTTLNDKECKHIMWSIVKFGLTKAGISNTLHTVIYGSWSLWGIGLFDPFFIQGSGQIDSLIKHFWKLTPSSPLLCANLSTLQLEVGREWHILKTITIKLNSGYRHTPGYMR